MIQSRRRAGAAIGLIDAEDQRPGAPSQQRISPKAPCEMLPRPWQPAVPGGRLSGRRRHRQTDWRSSVPRLAALAFVTVTGCATTLEESAGSEFATTSPGTPPPAYRDLVTPRSPSEQRSSIAIDGSLEAYTRWALERSPALRAQYEEWHASTYGMKQARRLPEPTVSYSYFVRAVETRVGPQRHRVGISQTFPWPARLARAADAASFASQSAQQRYEAAALELMRRVAEAYWKLWLVERSREVQRDQQKLLGQVSGSAQARLEVGQGSLADLSQINLNLSRIADTLAGLEESERQARAELIAAIGAEPGTETPIADEPPPLLRPAESSADLRRATVEHPRVQAMAYLAEAETQRGRAAAAERYPGFTLGADYIVTEEARMDGVEDSGKDAVMVMLGVKVPIWGGVYGAEQDEADARSAMFRSREDAIKDTATAELEQTLSQLDDSIRRVKLYRHTLVPQAEAVYGSVLGGYQASESTVSAMLAAQRDLLDLQLGLYRSQSEHALAWARLEAIVGRPIRVAEAK